MPGDKLLIESLSHEGRGIASMEGKCVFVNGGLPGETVEVRYLRQKKRFSEAEVIEVLIPSEHRVNPPCAYTDRCGGCQLQHMAPSYQLKMKEQMVLEQLKHFGGVTPKEVLPAVSGPVVGYRRKARLGVRWVQKKDKVLVGFREKRGHYLADIGECVVLDPRVGQHLTDLADTIAQLESYQHIPQIEVSIGDKALALIVRHLQALSAQDEARLVEYGQRFNVQIFAQPNGPDSIRSVYPKNPESLEYQLKSFGLSLRFSPGDFIQVNSVINEQLITRAIEWLALEPTDRVLDLFCGLGNFSLPLAKSAKQVVGVEGSEGLVNKAKQNVQYNQITNAQFFCADLSTSFSGQSWAQEPYDKILIDPPRSGAEGCLPWIIGSGAKRLVYVSCNPATFARDAGILAEQGFQLTRLSVFDMFPQTVHVETVGVFDRL